MGQSSRGGRRSPGLGAGEEQIWRSYSYRHKRQLLRVNNLDVECRRCCTSGEHPNRAEPNWESLGERRLRVVGMTSSVYETEDAQQSCGSRNVRGWSKSAKRSCSALCDGCVRARVIVRDGEGSEVLVASASHAGPAARVAGVGCGKPPSG